MRPSGRAAELAGTTVLALALAVLPIVLFHYQPILFAHLIAEDFAGEYATAAAFAGAGLLFFYDAFKSVAWGRKAIGALMSLAAILIAGEEISWGQRALGLATPEVIRAANVQLELNLHNLAAVGLSNQTYRWGAGLMLVWLALSSLMFLIASRSAARLGDLGIPFVPLKLVPICALPTMFFLFRPVAQPLEVGELLLGMAALSFALDRAWHSGLSVSGWLPDRPAALGGALLLGALIGVGCAVHTPLNWMAWRLETLAARDYPTFGLYDQAERIFDFIYAHPDQLVREDTRLSHAEMLVSAGRIERARAIFDAVLSDLPDLASGERLRRIAVLHARLGDEEHAQASYRAALDADAAALEVAGDADHRARLKLSLARTFRALGALDEAARVAGEARDLAVLARTRDEIAKWLEELAAERH